RGGEEDVAVARGQRQHLGGHVLGQPVFEAGRIGVDHLGHAGDLGRGLGGLACVVAGHQDVHVTATLGGGSDGVERGALDGGVVVFCNNECGHLFCPQITLASVLSLAT